MADMAALMDIRVDNIIQLKEKEFRLMGISINCHFGITHMRKTPIL